VKVGRLNRSIGEGSKIGLALELDFKHLDGNAFMSRDVYGHLCTNHGSKWQLDGRYFDGVGSYIETAPIPYTGVNDHPYALAVRVKITQGETDGNIILMKGGSWLLPPLAMDSGKFRGYSWMGSSPVSVYSTTISEADKGYRVVNTWDPANGLCIFVNGDKEASTPQSTYSASGVDNYISLARTGGGCSGDKGWLCCTIGEACIYSFADYACRILDRSIGR